MVKKPKKKGGFFLHFIPYVVAISSAIAAITPHHSEDQIVQTIKLISNILALNVGYNASLQHEVPVIDLDPSYCKVKSNE